MAIFKKGVETGMTQEQQKEFDELIKAGKKDVAGAYLKQCEEENYTEDYQERLRTGQVEGFGMDPYEL
jgi:hypothetical protein